MCHNPEYDKPVPRQLEEWCVPADPLHPGGLSGGTPSFFFRRYEGAPKGKLRTFRLLTCADCQWRIYEKNGTEGKWRIDLSVEDVQTGKVEKQTISVPQCILRRKDEDDDEESGGGPGKAEMSDLQKLIRDRLHLTGARQYAETKEYRDTKMPLCDLSTKPMIDPSKQEKPKSYGRGRRAVYEEEPKPEGENKWGWRQ